jgi:hypothetical protein
MLVAAAMTTQIQRFDATAIPFPANFGPSKENCLAGKFVPAVVMKSAFRLDVISESNCFTKLPRSASSSA